MDDFMEEFNAAKAGEVAAGVFIALIAFKVAKGILRACLE
jgi:hypothetical protein